MDPLPRRPSEKLNNLPGEEEMFKLLITQNMNEEDQTLSEKQLLHLHRIFGHLPPEKLNKHIQKSGFADEGKVLQILKKISAKDVVWGRKGSLGQNSHYQR